MEEVGSFTDLNLVQELQQTKIRQLEAILPIPKKKSTYTYKELHEKKDEIQKFLIPELIPANAVSVLIGEDGIGKTQILTQLCLCIAFKRDVFLGMRLQAEKNRCLIVATEEGRQKFTSAIVKQAYALEPHHKPEDVLVSFTEGSDFDDFITLKDEIEGLLKQFDHDLIIIDALSDLFTLIDGDINSNSHARKLLSFFQHLCNTYNVTIIIIHHAAKTKITEKHKLGKIFVEKNDSQGAGAITQKARTVLALTNDPKTFSDDGSGYTNYLHVVKANLMGKYYESNAIRARFNSVNLLHTFEGLTEVKVKAEGDTSPNEIAGTAQTAEANANRKATPKEISDESHYATLNDIYYSVEVMTRLDLISKMQKHYGVGKTKIESKDGFLPYIIEKGFIEKIATGYKYKRPKNLIPIKQAKANFDDGYDEAAPF